MKILYLMHVPWGWIKQRPHFLALELSKFHDIDILYRKALTVKGTSLVEEKDKNQYIKGVTTIPFEKIPLLNSVPGINVINIFLLNSIKKIRHISQYDVVWFSSVHLYVYFESLIKDNQKVIYDCMDDELEFQSIIKYPKLRKKIEQAEKRLISRADFTFFSANYLAKKVISRTKNDLTNYSILNNALMPEEIEKICEIPQMVIEKKNLISKKFKTLLYVGAIAEWFDFDLMIKALNDNNDLQLVLLGPNQIEIPSHKRIIHLGTVERKYVFDFMKIADCLVMPFIVTELIKSVNPVKLYEYISMNKPIIAPKYEESEKFDEYVYLYDDQQSLLSLCEQVAHGKLAMKASIAKNQEYVSLNTWECRGKYINKIITSMQ